MNDILAVISQNILPIFIVAGFGVGLRRWQGLDKRPFSGAVFNVLSPCLVFSSLVNSRLPSDELLGLVAFALLTILTVGGIALLVARLLRLSRENTAALLIVVMFANSGNYGLTLNQLRYGDAGLSRAVVYYVTSTVLLYTVGVFVASLGQLDRREALVRLSRLPAVYAAIAAIFVYWFDLPLPEPVVRGITIAGQGAIPVMLLVLGMQMADFKGAFEMRLAVPAIALRLLLAPMIAVGITLLLGLQELSRSTAIIEASMPPAVFTIILATEFDLQPTAVTGIVVAATLLSPLTVALVINGLGL